MASEGQKRKPTLPYPKELKPFFNKPRLPSAALGRLRRVIDDDPVFRARLAAGALPELVDEIGRLWLEHGDGWADAASELAAQIDAVAESGDVQAQLRRADKRRDAAEQVAARTRAELIQRNEFIELQATEVDELRAEVAKAGELLAEMKAEMADVRMEIRHARDREAAAVAKAQTAADERRSVRDQPAPAQAPERRASTRPQRRHRRCGRDSPPTCCTARNAAGTAPGGRCRGRTPRNVDRSVRRSFAWRRHRKLWRSGRVPRPVRRSAHHRRLQRGEARLAESSARGAARRVA